MTQYLTTHFRYPTLNSWNRSTSYACNLKITHLGLSPEVVDKLFDMIQTQEFFDAMEFITVDTADKDNVGIRSLYIIRFADDTDQERAYRGDGNDTPGINIGKS